MTELATAQHDDEKPPEVEKILAIAVDSTSRVYDLSTIDFGTKGNEVTANKNQNLFVTIEADGAAIYFSLSPTAALTISDTASITAGAALAFTATKCWKIPADGERRYRIDRGLHRYLYLKTATGTAIARVYVSSALPPGAVV